MRKLIFALLLTTTALAQDIDRNQPVEPFPIVGNIHYVGASDVTSFLITSPKGHILIDGGYEETAPMIVANIRKLGFRVEDVKIILNSHAHTDHAGGIAELKKLTGATFYAMRGDVAQLARGGLDDPHFGNRFRFTPVEADRILEDGQRISLGGTTLVAHLTAGHTPGCTTWTTRTAGKNVVFVCSPTAPGYKLNDNPRAPTVIADFRKQFKTLKTLGCDVFLGSHGVFFGLSDMIAGKKKFAGCDEYHAFLSDIEQGFEKRVRAGE